ncbi:MAG: hypothetical protein E6G38_00070 [Actinobacteria bacterium]|nr:MAG: hypothetical protein E6G38_00070 [Actinomycetota bacterium]
MRSLAFVLLALLTVLTVLLHRGASAAAKPGDLRLSAIASELARRQVTIRCEGLSGALTGVRGESGRTEFIGGKPVSVSYLQEGICQTLHAYTRALKAGPSCLLPCEQPLEIAWSVNTIAHESYHLAGVRNEAQTQCYALQAIDFVARRLGASPDQARALASFSFDQLPRRMPPEYSSPECHDGGAYDLRPNSAVWP